VGLAVFSPIIVIAAAVIKFDSPGPVLLPQLRYGPDRKSFKLYRFRTTRFGKIDRDVKRIGCSPIARMLRSTGIDRLPQLINLIRGDMAIVGPQPYVMLPNYTSQLTQISRSYTLRPGLTGWAKVNGCRDTVGAPLPAQKRLAHDLYYAEHWSLRLDLTIILMSLLSRNMYAIARTERLNEPDY
jgi:putative colanic acid biosynthesis UDP-glucose lipid carrier transferase